MFASAPLSRDLEIFSISLRGPAPQESNVTPPFHSYNIITSWRKKKIIIVLPYIWSIGRAVGALLTAGMTISFDLPPSVIQF